MPSPRRLATLIAGNALVFALIFSTMELGYRVYRDGVPQAFINIANYFSDVPYSDLGTGSWIINDDVLGYRFNPTEPGVNSLSIRHPEVTIPKPPGLNRIIVLGDSLPYH